jgi:predicted nicotinamide N-methyase
MDPQTLPAHERELYNTIKNRYTVAFEPLKIREHKLQLLKITDLEQILEGKDPLKDVSTFPFWIRLWEAAIVLSEYVAGLPNAKGASLLELGAGLGAPGLTAAAAGFDVTLSDYEELILDFERINAAASRLDTVRFAMLDWLDPPEMEQFDVIIGAEILFREEFFQPLLNVLRRALKPDGVVYLAHDVKRRSLEPFLKLAEKEYRISASQRKLKSLDEDKIILLTRLQPRG